MNDMGAQGWEYQRAETLPSIERSGLTGSTTEWRNLLVFRRAARTPMDDFQPELLPPPAATDATTHADASHADTKAADAPVQDAQFEDGEPKPTDDRPAQADDGVAATTDSADAATDNGVEDTEDMAVVPTSLKAFAETRNTSKSDD